MRTRVYVDGKPAWSENIPASVEMQGYGGHALEERGPKPKPIVERKPRDYHASVAKGHETRRLRGIG